MKKNNYTDIYVPVLLRFFNDKVSIPGELIKNVKSNLVDSSKTEITLNEDNANNIDAGFDLSYQCSRLKDVISDVDNYSCIDMSLYYYHHRLIFKIRIGHDSRLDKKFSSLVRDRLHEIIKEEMEIFMEIYESTLIDYFSDQLDVGAINIGRQKKDSQVIGYYSYPIVIQKVKKSYIEKMTNRLETMFFKIYLPNKNPLSFGTDAHIRISIPGIILFYNKEMSAKLTADFINTVYETGLYKKKIQDNAEVNKLKHRLFSRKPNLNNEELNRFDEQILEGMWEHFLDTLDGKISTHQQNKVARNSYIFALFGLFAAMFAILSQIYGFFG